MKINNLKIWIKIKKSEFKNINHLLKELRENNFIALSSRNSIKCHHQSKTKNTKPKNDTFIQKKSSDRVT